MSYKNLVQIIGNTPVMELIRYSTRKVKILAKLEGNNPGGSVKDRISLYMIRDAERKGLIKNLELLEPTSGNTGIGLAMISAFRGYRFTAVMPESVSRERRQLLQAYGAKIILTDGVKGTNYAIEVARKLIMDQPKKWLMLDQFENRANVLAHYQTTGWEIANQVPRITHFVAGMGTGGTLMGVGRRLKEFNRKIKIVGIEPKVGSKIQGLRNMAAYSPGIYHQAQLDQKLLMNEDESALSLVKDLFKKEGLSVGMSSGAALWGALKVAKTIKKGVIVTIFPDRGDKYLTTFT